MKEMEDITYKNLNILAPMVRIGTLPTRLLALDYGADLVYSEEIIDFKMLQCERKENHLLNTVDFVMRDGTLAFRTCQQEKHAVVFQMGTADAARALKVAKMVENDVAAIDINMGCPKEFSLKGGMGAALLKKPEKIKEILTNLVSNLKIRVTCKIRVLDTASDLYVIGVFSKVSKDHVVGSVDFAMTFRPRIKVEATLELARMIESTGVRALAVHGRLTEERPRHLCRYGYLRAVAQALTIPVIANGGSGDVKCYADLAKFREHSGCSSVMLARAAQWNPSIFRAQGLLPVDDVVNAYLKYAIRYDNEIHNTKYCVQTILHEELATERGLRLQASGLPSEIYAVFGMLEHYELVAEEHKQKRESLKRKSGGEEAEDILQFKRVKLPEDGSEVVELPLVFNRKEYDRLLPKTVLYEHSIKEGHGIPSYYSMKFSEDKTFYCRVCYNGQKFASSVRVMSKKWGEQAAAAVCLRYLDLGDCRKDSVKASNPLPQPAEQPSQCEPNITSQSKRTKCTGS